MRTCTKCGLEKSVKEFYKAGRGDKYPRSQCKACDKKRIKKRQQEKPRAVKNEFLKRTYGIDHDQFDQMLVRCDGKCEVCGRPPKKKALCVDHCHDTGKVRGLLCSNCNTALGLLGDDLQRILKLSQYLAQSRPLA